MKLFLAFLLSAVLSGSPQMLGTSQPSPEDFRVLSDKVTGSERVISATPSPLVCAKKIDIRIDARSNVIKSVIFTGGCPGNAKAVNSLLQGMTVEQAVKKLNGIDCAGRGTSCTDQLSRVLKKCYKLQGSR